MAYDDDGDSVVTLVSNVESVVTAVEFLQPVEFGRVVDEVDQVLEVESGQEQFDDEVDHTFGVKDLEEEEGDEVGEQEDEELVEEEFEDEVVEEENEEDFGLGGFHPVRAGSRLNSSICFTRMMELFRIVTLQVLHSEEIGYWCFCTSLAVQRFDEGQAGCGEGAQEQQLRDRDG